MARQNGVVMNTYEMMRLGHLLVSMLSLLIFFACSSNKDGDSLDQEMSFDINIAAELARLNLHGYEQLTDFLDGQLLTLPEPYQLHTVLLTRQLFAGELFDLNEAVPIGFVASRASAIYVVFRGTRSISEWIDNVTFPQTRYDAIDDFGKAHLGFHGVYESVQDDLLAAVSELSDSGAFSTLYITGHSLGGAVAVLAAPDLAAQALLTPVMYNFAAPRVGDETFQERYHEAIQTSWRVVNNRDLVPDLPPASVIAVDVFPPETLTYAHVSNVREFTFGRSINSPLDVLSIVLNHDICNYYEAICDQTNAPMACTALAGGVHDCQP